MATKENFSVVIKKFHPGVTGSAILVQINYPNGTKELFLVDCGLFQEPRYVELNDKLPCDPKDLSFVLVTHNHCDHIGRLPLLTARGFNKPIFTSESTAKLMSLSLRDNLRVLTDKAKKEKKPFLYGGDSVDRALSLLKTVPYYQTYKFSDNIKFTFLMNGHLTGASMILVQISSAQAGGKGKINLLFSGDYSSRNVFFDVPPLPAWIRELPICIISEATYGSIESKDIKKVYANNVTNALNEGKIVLSPVFSLGRAQKLLYFYRTLQEAGVISTDIPIYLDGHLTQNYTNLYINDGFENKEELRGKNFLPLNWTYESYVDRVKRPVLVQDGKQKIILSSSGMGSYGPSAFYIPALLTRKNVLIHFTGYAAEGTLARKLFEAKSGETVDINGKNTYVGAEVKFTSEFSDHAKADELIEFYKSFDKVQCILINHGEPEDQKNLRNRAISEGFNPNSVILLSENDIRIGEFSKVIKILPAN